ncbi:MAG: YlxR family protein [Candidatus Binatia bacterium]
MPIRTCVGCRNRDEQSRLLRFAAGADGTLVSGRGKGRGGYLHPRRECVRAFIALRTGFVRSLKVIISREARERHAALLEHSAVLLP